MWRSNEESDAYVLKNAFKFDISVDATGNTCRGKQNEIPILIHREKKQLQITDFIQTSAGKSISNAIIGVKSTYCDDDDSKRNKHLKDDVDVDNKGCTKRNVPCYRYKTFNKEKVIMSGNESDNKQQMVDSKDDEATGESSNTEEKVVKHKKLLKKKESNALVDGRSSRDPCSEPVAGPSRVVLSPTRPVGGNLTSTPVKIKNLKNKERKRGSRSKRGRFIRRRSVQVAKKLLEEAAGVSLSTSSTSTGAT